MTIFLVRSSGIEPEIYRLGEIFVQDRNSYNIYHIYCWMSIERRFDGLRRLKRKAIAYLNKIWEAGNYYTLDKIACRTVSNAVSRLVDVSI